MNSRNRKSKQQTSLIMEWMQKAILLYSTLFESIILIDGTCSSKSSRTSSFPEKLSPGGSSRIRSHSIGLANFMSAYIHLLPNIK